MLPATIEYLLSLSGHGDKPRISNRVAQVAIPSFPPLQTITYRVGPLGEIFAYIVYELSFGQAMVPHSFDAKIYQGGNTLLNAVISGRFIEQSQNSFAFVIRAQPLDFTITNRRLLTNYYESTIFYLEIADEESYKMAMDALRRMHTSLESENLANQMLTAWGGR